MSTSNITKISLFLATFLFAGCFEKNSQKSDSLNGSSSETTMSAQDLAAFTTARFKTTKGDFTITFLPDKAPATVSRIKQLINQKFYDGIKFHRVIPNVLVQAGDPSGTGMSGSGKKIKAEFNELKHLQGIVSMARKGNDIHSADSQFFICLKELNHLDGQYSIFAKVMSGLENVQSLTQGDQILRAFLE